MKKFMKQWGARILTVLAFVMISLAPVAAFAEEVATAVPVVQVDPLHQILNLVLPALLGLMTAFFAWVSKNGKQWIAQKASEANTKESAAWYSTALYLAGIAVKYAETRFGPDTGRGKEKKEAAVEWLRARILSIDKSFFEKTPNAEKFLETLVDAAYHDVFAVVSPLAGSRA